MFVRLDCLPIHRGTLHCHCESRRRATSSPITTWISVPRSAFAFTKGAGISSLRQAFGVVSVRIVGHPSHMRMNRKREKFTYMRCRCSMRTMRRRVFVNEQLPWFEALEDLPRFATTRRDGASPIRIGPKKKLIDLSCRGPVLPHMASRTPSVRTFVMYAGWCCQPIDQGGAACFAH
jgi:hypothetical protein